MRERTWKIYQPRILARQHFAQEQSFRVRFGIRSCDFVDRKPGTKKNDRNHTKTTKDKNTNYRENLVLTLILCSSYFASSNLKIEL